ncbi:uncharacterized protein EV154DRAFT_488204 [Mucor mucedo]|uniref:uncharacterized protein n=1 Tax=Mucor mucedo TaxID=29922 RepID=UPI00221E9C48|nr:uncharacterized protein EV154DRAFT_488204 [Mucor mucedo]KAI7868055.1 hypothetical protein EV154DRAFT_488204 [Mucor mucedo]
MSGKVGINKGIRRVVHFVDDEQLIFHFYLVRFESFTKLTGKRGQTPTVSKRQLRTKNNKVKTKTAERYHQSPEEPDTSQNRKRKTPVNPKSSEKRPRVLAADVQWCILNVSDLTLKVFALEYGHYNRRRCHARYKTILTNMSEEDHSRLLEEFENWCLTLDCTVFWKERQRIHALETTASNCSQVINDMLLSDSQSLLEPQNQSPTVESPTPRPTQETTASQPIAATTTTDLDQEHAKIRKGSDNEEKHWIVDGNDITSLFQKYRHQADIIPKPVPLESNIQEILALSGVLFLANEQHSERKVTVFGEQVLKNLLECQTQSLLSKVPHNTPNLPMMTSWKWLVKLPLEPVADKNQFGEVDVQTRYYDPWLSSILADTTKKVVLRWPNKKDTSTTGIRPDAIVSTLLTVLSRNSVLKWHHPILTSQAYGFQLVFYMTQMIHTNFFTRIEIGRITLPESLSCLHSSVTLKNIRTLLRVTLIFWHCCYQADSPTVAVAPVSTLSPKVTYPIEASTFSSLRNSRYHTIIADD